MHSLVIRAVFTIILWWMNKCFISTSAFNNKSIRLDRTELYIRFILVDLAYIRPHTKQSIWNWDQQTLLQEMWSIVWQSHLHIYISIFLFFRFIMKTVLLPKCNEALSGKDFLKINLEGFFFQVTEKSNESKSLKPWIM